MFIETKENHMSINKKFYAHYAKLNGSINTFEEYEKHLNIFFLLTKQSYVDGEGISRNDAFCAWMYYCEGEGAGLPKTEAHLFFDSVDQVYSYS